MSKWGTLLPTTCPNGCGGEDSYDLPIGRSDLRDLEAPGAGAVEFLVALETHSKTSRPGASEQLEPTLEPDTRGNEDFFHP